MDLSKYLLEKFCMSKCGWLSRTRQTLIVLCMRDR